MTCRICDKRRARRFCPGVNGEICPICCATEREVTVSCPLDCEYLIESREREQFTGSVSDLPHSDIPADSRFIDAHQVQAGVLMGILRKTISDRPELLDCDVREALESLIRTYRTRDTGLLYETKPESKYAADLYAALQEHIASLLEHLGDSAGRVFPEKTILRVLVFASRVGAVKDNGKPKGRAFIHFLRDMPTNEPAPESQIVL